MLQNDVSKPAIKEPSDQLVLIKEASQSIGVHPDTIRRWARLGKIKSRRHPINGYRLFDIQDIYRVVEQIFGHEK